MASTRITREMRDDIVTKIVAGHFKARKEALELKRVAYADAVYAHHFPAEQVAAARALNKMDAGWVEMKDTVYIEPPKFTGVQRKRGYRSEGPEYEHRMSKDQPFPHVHEGLSVDAKHPCFKQDQAILKEYLAILDAEHKLSEKLRALLQSCSTLKQLKAAWPEGEAYYPVEPPNYRTALVPVTLTNEINKMLGIASLPKSGAAKAILKAATTK